VKQLREGSQDNSNGRGFFWVMKVVVVLVVLMGMSRSAPTQAAAEGRIQITLVKTGYGEGSGLLFYEGQRYGLGISGTKLKGFLIRKVNLTGTVLNLRSAGDIIGAYTAVDGDIAIVGPAKIARLENSKGVVLEIQGVNLRRSFALNLAGMSIKNLGWQPSPESN
jgi:hypothetical protein